ncbi:GntR family transcriptional regulator [Oceanibium sediminis]|uniref:GntR family transcriptional regulator n=1 Tax=Oceanibium sediminis TaxID=2026339 RepID=UPI000DD2DAFC|nr:GntR family transcriptional regulator [Oceanibium sediminis]
MSGPTRTQWAYAELKARVMDNRLRAGQSYLEQSLAEELGVSRTPLREAALRLEAEGFVTIRPRLGILVRPISAEDMADVYDILTALEPFAARMLAERALSAEELEQLIAPVEQMDACLARGDLAAWAVADRAFHAALIGLAGNPRLDRIIATLWDQVHRARMATLSARRDLAASNLDHRRLVAHIANGEADAAEALHRRHRRAAGKALVRLLGPHGEDGL